MFQVEHNRVYELPTEVSANYTIQPNDILELQIFTNEGERIIDPDFELLKDMSAGGNMANMRPNIDYQIAADGTTILPLVGRIKLDNMTIREAQDLLSKEYSNYYNKPFVNIRYLNKRVSVVGVVNAVVPLENENTRLIEVLAAANAIDNNAIVQNVRLIRGDETYVFDLSSSKDVKKTNIIVQPNDIVYVEPLRRPFIEGVRDYGPVIGLVSSVTALIVVISSLAGGN